MFIGRYKFNKKKIQNFVRLFTQQNKKIDLDKNKFDITYHLTAMRKGEFIELNFYGVKASTAADVKKLADENLDIYE